MTWLLHQSLPDLLRNLLRNPVEPGLALHQSLRHLLLNPVEPEPPKPCPEPSPKPVELDLALHQSLPDLLRNLPWLCTKASWILLRDPRWTWPGACTSAHRSYSGLKTPLAYAVGEKGSNIGHLLEVNSCNYWFGLRCQGNKKYSRRTCLNKCPEICVRT